jgi:anti-anti-sigma regulatory factor
MTSPRFEFNDNSGFIKQLGSGAANPNIVINCASIEQISDEELFQIKELYHRNSQQAGIIVISELRDELIEKMEMTGLHCIPSDDEAADYVYMEQIEKDLLKSFDDSEG